MQKVILGVLIMAGVALATEVTDKVRRQKKIVVC